MFLELPDRFGVRFHLGKFLDKFQINTREHLALAHRLIDISFEHKDFGALQLSLFSRFFCWFIVMLPLLLGRLATQVSQLLVKLLLEFLHLDSFTFGFTT